jgi:hypothetical protein
MRKSLVRGVLAVCTAVLSGTALAGSAGATATGGFPAARLATANAVPIDGPVLRPIAIKRCKGGNGKLEGERVTQLQCTSTGTLTGRPRVGGVSNGWLWTRHASGRTDDLSYLGVNFGDGVLTLTLTGSVKVIGKPTNQSGHATTTGTWQMKSGTGLYAGLTGTGTYSFDFKRNATRYISFTMTLRGGLR